MGRNLARAYFDYSKSVLAKKGREMRTRYRLYRLLDYSALASVMGALRFPFATILALDNVARRLQERRIINAEVYMEGDYNV